MVGQLELAPAGNGMRKKGAKRKRDERAAVSAGSRGERGDCFCTMDPACDFRVVERKVS